jgi:heme/copper-type cytochrome/quinol oxidase subunit 1
MDEKLGKWTFWVFFLGFNLTFMPMHWIGLLGMPRRIFTYYSELGLDNLNLIVTIGAFIQAISIVMLFTNVVKSYLRGAPAPNNPWGGATLEWATTSPPAPHNFNRIPVIHSREPLWVEPEQVMAAVAGPLEPMHMPPNSFWPILTGFGVVLTFGLFLVPYWWAPLIGLAWTAIGVVNWAFEQV